MSLMRSRSKGIEKGRQKLSQRLVIPLLRWCKAQGKLLYVDNEWARIFTPLPGTTEGTWEYITDYKAEILLGLRVDPVAARMAKRKPARPALVPSARRRA